MKASQIPQKLVTLLALSMLLLLSACAKKHDIVGTWVGTDQVSTINETVTLTLNSDKSYVGEIKLSGTRPDAEITMTERGTYRMEGEGRLVTVGHDYAYDNIPKGREDQMRELMEKIRTRTAPTRSHGSTMTRSRWQAQLITRSPRSDRNSAPLSTSLRRELHEIKTQQST